MTKHHPTFLGEGAVRFSEHHTALQTRDRHCDPEIWNSYRKIGFIRHPYTWVQSIYQERHFNHMMEEDRFRPFPEYMRRLHTNMFRWLVDEEGKLLVDVYRMEDFAEIEKEFDIEIEHRNSTDTNKKPSITSDIKEIIHDKFAREMEYYVRLP